MHVILTYIAKHHRTHHQPLQSHDEGKWFHYGQDVLVEQYNGLVKQASQARAMAAELSRQQHHNGWCSIFVVPVLQSLAQAQEDGWDPRRPLRKQRSPLVTYFAGCPVAWDQETAGLHVDDNDDACAIALPAATSSPSWPADLQAQLFPVDELEHRPEPKLPHVHEQAFGIVLEPGPSVLRTLRDDCLTLGLAHSTANDMRALQQQFPGAVTFEELVQTVHDVAARHGSPQSTPVAPVDEDEDEDEDETVPPPPVVPEAEDKEGKHETVPPPPVVPEAEDEEDVPEEDEEGKAEGKTDTLPSPEVVAAAASIMTA